MTRRKPVSLYVALALTLLSILGVTFGSGLIRLIPSILLVFILPGFTFLAAWFPNRLTDTASASLFTLALSLAIVAVGGVILHLAPGGLIPESWTFWLGGMSLINGVVGLQRKRFPFTPVPADKFFGFRLRHAALVLVATIVVFGAFTYARRGVIEQPRPGFTQLWMQQGKEAGSFVVGVQNEEDQPVRYRLVIVGSEGIAENNISLEPGAKWENLFWLTALPSLQLEALLYRMDDPETVYRNATLWLPDGG